MPRSSILRHHNTDYFLLFFFNDTATTEIYTLSLHDALPIYLSRMREAGAGRGLAAEAVLARQQAARSEEHTSELQSQFHLVCRLLLEKKKKNNTSAPRKLRALYRLLATSIAIAHACRTTCHQ